MQPTDRAPQSQSQVMDQPARPQQKRPSANGVYSNRRSRNPLLNFPIAYQLTFGFLVAAIVAALGAGVAGTQRAQSLSRQAQFYQARLSSNTQLTTGATYLQLMDTKLHAAFTDVTISQESLQNDISKLNSFSSDFDAILTNYQTQGLLNQNSDQKALIIESNHGEQINRQIDATNGVARNWKTYKDTQTQIMQLLNQYQSNPHDQAPLNTANNLERLQGEPTNADAISSMRQLIQLDNRLAKYVQTAASIDAQNQTIVTIVAIVVAFLLVVLVGWVISNGMVRRITQLGRVSEAIERGQLDERAYVSGRDELAHVAVSVNGMLNTIVGLLDETRRQRDALTQAADRLFSDIRVAGAGNLGVNATVSNDPIGMLGNAFNLTIGRFRRFMLRMQSTIEQLDVIARREIKNTQLFFGTMKKTSSTPLPNDISFKVDTSEITDSPSQSLVNPINRARDLVYQISQEGTSGRLRSVLEHAEEAYLSLTRMNQLVTSLPQARSPATVAHLAQLQAQEIVMLEGALRKLGNEASAMQNNAQRGLNDLFGVLEQIATALRDGALAMPGGDSTLQMSNISAIMRIANMYAQEMAELSNELTIVIQEMRTGIAPFRLENMDGSAAYMGPQSRPAVAPRYEEE
jgi:methyl-accepting chemotaxis protein